MLLLLDRDVNCACTRTAQKSNSDQDRCIRFDPLASPLLVNYRDCILLSCFKS